MANPPVRVETADTEAAEWHARLGASQVPASEIEAFFAWRSASPANADAYRRVERIWGQTDKLKSDPDMGAALDEVLGRSKPVRPAGLRLPRTLIGVTAIGAVLALGVAGWVWSQGQGRYATAVGEQRSVQLADGSSVRLDTDTRIRVRFDGAHRNIELLDGRAMFEVAHDRSRPFVVEAGGVQVTAVGTVFDVRRRGDGASVVLVSGVVDVADGAAVRTRMTAGSRAEVGRRGAVVQAVDVRSQTSWAEGRITLRDTPLSDAVAEVNRYLTDKVALDPSVRGDVLINGVFRTGDRDAFVSTAAEGLGLTSHREADGTVRLSARRK